MPTFQVVNYVDDYGNDVNGNGNKNGSKINLFR